MLVAESDGVILGVLLKPHQTLIAHGQLVPQPHPTNPLGTDVDVLKPQLVGNALGAVGRLLKAHRQNPLLDFR